MKRIGKRLLCAAICLVMVLAMLPVVSFAADTMTLYCQAPEGWTNCKVYWWGSAQGVEWPGMAMTADSDGIWFYDVPADATNVIFNNGSGTQSADLTVPTDDKVMFVYENKTWDVYGRQEIVINYYVAGTFNEWNCAHEDYLMIANEDGTYTMDVSVTAGAHSLKVTNGTWDKSWGGDGAYGNYDILAATDGVISVTFDPVSCIVDVSGDCLEGIVLPPDLFDATYYVAGDFNEWKCAAKDYQMHDDGNGIYTLQIPVATGAYGLKVTDGTWFNSWGANGGSDNYVLRVFCDGTVTISFDINTGMISVTGDCLNAGTVSLYCQAPDSWTGCNVYWWGSAQIVEWPGVAMTADSDGIWYCDVPADATGVLFNDGVEQSFDQLMPTDDKVMFLYETNTWDVYGRQEIELAYYVAGSFNQWDCAAPEYKMNDNGDGTYTLELALAAGPYALKVTDGTWDNSWGGLGEGGNYDIIVATDGTITVTFDAVNEVVTVTGDCLGEIVPDPLEINTIHAVGAAGLLGAEWDPIANEMTGENGIYTITFTGIAAGTYEFKFAANGNWDISWGAGVEMESDVEYDAWFNGGNCSVTVAEDGSDVVLTLDLSAMDAVTGEGAKCSVSVSTVVAGVTVNGSVTSKSALGTVTVELSNDTDSYTAATEDGAYTIEGVAAGTYTMTISAEGLVTYTCEITVDAEPVTQDAKLCVKGDITGDGKVNVMDVARIYTHAKGGKQLTDYAFACADMTGDGKVNVMDTARAYKIAKS